MKKIGLVLAMSFVSISLLGGSVSRASTVAPSSLIQSIGNSLSIGAFQVAKVPLSINPLQLIPKKQTVLVTKNRAYRVVVSKTVWRVKEDCNDFGGRSLSFSVSAKQRDSNKFIVNPKLGPESKARGLMLCPVGSGKTLEKQTFTSSKLWIAPKSAYVKFEIPRYYDLKVLPL